MGLFRKPPPPPAPSPKPQKKKGSRTAKLAFLGPIYVGLAGVAALGLMLVYCSAVYPDPMSMGAKQRPPLVRILAADGSLLAERGGGDAYVPLDLIPRYVAQAVIATEDRRFYEHRGIDPIGLLRAAFANARSHGFVQGGSTLTQQLAKNLYLSNERTMARKLEEIALAIWLEARLSKSDILELYLNRVYLGGGAYGVDAAARRYYGKSARRLSLAEAALLAGLLKAPSRYSPLSSPDAATARGVLVLAQMRQAGFITAGQERDAAAKMPEVARARQQLEANGAGYATDYAMDEVSELVNAGNADITVETTIDPQLQKRTAAIVENALADRGTQLQAGQAAAVVMSPDGAVRAMIGGSTYAETQFNRAVTSRRQPGSAFKPFVYLAALQAGYTPDSVVEDLPISVSGWAPRNDNGEYRGKMTMRNALAKSVNSVSVRLTLKVGPKRVADIAHRLGIQSPLRKDASIALGTSEVSLLELTGAYNVLANAGRTAEPYVIRRIYTRTGTMLYARKPPQALQIVASMHVGAMNEMLNAAMVWGTGHRAALPQHPAAGKTGTSQGYRDAWFVGYTAHLTAGVWAGNDDGSEMNHVVGGTLPASIWREIMLAAHAGKAPMALPGTSLARTKQAVAPYPSETIGDDFIARALGEQRRAYRDVPPAASSSQ